MGAKNALAAYAMFPGIGHQPHRLLVYMALRTLDTDEPERPARLYFGGPEMLCEALGWDGRGAPPAATLRKVYRGLSDLSDAGAIRRRRAGGNGRRAEYELLLNPFATATPTATEPARTASPGSPPPDAAPMAAGECSHGLSAGLLPTGEPCCPLCRRGAA